jgi:hypothetical protein
MGCDHYLYLMLASTYHEELRPKLIKSYGQLSRSTIMREEKQRLQLEKLLRGLGGDKLMGLLGMGYRGMFTMPEPEGPMETYLK